MRYVTIPNPITTVDPLSDSALPASETFTFAKSCRWAYVVIAQRGTADVLTLLDLRRKTDAAVPGQCLELNEDEWKLLEGEFKRPNAQAFGIGWIFSAESHQRAILDAKTTKPAAMVEAPANGAAAVTS